jgi:hypothetical protein
LIYKKQKSLRRIKKKKEKCKKMEVRGRFRKKNNVDHLTGPASANLAGIGGYSYINRRHSKPHKDILSFA